MKKRIIYFCIFSMGLGVIDTSIANDIHCPDDIECTASDDISSCFCRYNEAKTDKWGVTPDGEEGAYIMKGTYDFHNAFVILDKENPMTETGCTYTYHDDHSSEARINCRAKPTNFMPLLKWNTMWKLMVNTYGVEYMCGSYNQLADNAACLLK